MDLAGHPFPLTHILKGFPSMVSTPAGFTLSPWDTVDHGDSEGFLISAVHVKLCSCMGYHLSQKVQREREVPRRSWSSWSKTCILEAILLADIH